MQHFVDQPSIASNVDKLYKVHAQTKHPEVQGTGANYLKGGTTPNTAILST
jgi:hypothetical protein